MKSNTIKVVTAKDLKPDTILGVVTENMDEAGYVRELEEYYGFPCAVMVMVLEFDASEDWERN